MLEIKSKTTVQWLQQTGALCLLQPIQRAVTRLETEQSSHRLTTNVKCSGELIKRLQKRFQQCLQNGLTTNYPAFKDALFITEESKLT